MRALPWMCRRSMQLRMVRLPVRPRRRAMTAGVPRPDPRLRASRPYAWTPRVNGRTRRAPNSAMRGFSNAWVVPRSAGRRLSMTGAGASRRSRIRSGPRALRGGRAAAIARPRAQAPRGSRDQHCVDQRSIAPDERRYLLLRSEHCAGLASRRIQERSSLQPAWSG